MGCNGLVEGNRQYMGILEGHLRIGGDGRIFLRPSCGSCFEKRLGAGSWAASKVKQEQAVRECLALGLDEE